MMDTPAGFSLCQYLYNVKHSVSETFLMDTSTPVLKAVEFAPTSDFEHKKIDVPACVLDFYGLKADPSVRDFQHKENSIFSNVGNLPLYVYMRALILVSNHQKDCHFFVRQYALDLAGLVTDQGRFGARVGLSQVTDVQEVREVQERNNHLVGWEVLWQQTVEIEPPNYEERLLGYPDVDMSDIYKDYPEFDPEDANINVDLTRLPSPVDDEDTDEDESYTETISDAAGVD